jgi:hypothetical protein
MFRVALHQSTPMILKNRRTWNAVKTNKRRGMNCRLRYRARAGYAAAHAYPSDENLETTAITRATNPKSTLMDRT